jgi:hypothetical protein
MRFSPTAVWTQLISLLVAVGLLTGLPIATRVMGQPKRAVAPAEVGDGRGTARPRTSAPDTTPPRVAISVPTPSSTVSRQVRVEGDVSDDTGVVKTELHADGRLVASTANPKAFSLVWDSSKAGAGVHTLVVKAYDAAGNVGSASVKVQVRKGFNVKRYGARGDGKSDDTAAIQAALDAAKGAGGGSVYIPPGTYLIHPDSGSVFSVGSNVEVRGDGPTSVLKIGPDAGNYNFIFGQWNVKARRSYPYVENVSFRHFRVDQNPSGNRAADIQENSGGQNVLQFYKFKNITVQGVHFDPEPGVQALVLAGPGADGVTVDGCSFRFVRGRSSPTPRRKYYDHSSVYTEAGQVLVRNNVFRAGMKEHAVTAVEVHGGPHVTVKDNRSDGFQVGLVVVNSTKEYPDVKDGDFVVENNQIRRTTQGISLWSVRGRTLRRVRVKGNAISMARHEHYKNVWLGVYLYYAAEEPLTDGNFEDIEISDNTISFEGLTPGTISAVGIDLAPAGRARHVIVKGNKILASPATGIHLGNAKTRNTLQDIRVEDNTIVDAGKDKTAEKQSRAAVLVDPATLIDVHVDNNVIKDTGRAGSPLGYWSVRAHPGPASKRVTLKHNRISPPRALRYDVDRTRIDAGTSP